jgi:succinyl-CoA synthetase alpha subunit
MLLSADSRVLVHGLGGDFARTQTAAMLAAGTRVVAGVSVGAAGSQVLGLPVFDTVADAVKATGADTSAIYVPAAGARDASSPPNMCRCMTVSSDWRTHVDAACGWWARTRWA